MQQQRPAPSIGTVEGGYRFKGGDPRQESSWEQVEPVDVSSAYGAGARQLPNGTIERVGPRGGVQRIGTAGGRQGGAESSALVGADARARFMTGIGPLTDAQRNFTTLEAQGNPLNRDWGAALVDEYTNVPGLRGIGDALARNIGGEDYQKYTQARSTYESSLLPILSGAAVTPSEAERLIRADLPQLGDTPAVLAAKARNRAQRINAVAQGIGQESPFPVDQAADQPGDAVAIGQAPETAIDYTDPNNRQALADLIATGGWIRNGQGQPYQVAPGGIQLAQPDAGDTQVAEGVYQRPYTPEGAVAEREATPDWWRRLDSVIRGVADTATFGLADEIAAGGDALIGRGEGDTLADRYQNNLQVQRAIDRADTQEVPLSRFAGQVGGGLVAPGAAAAGRFISSAPNIGGAVARGALTGAVAGGAYGAGNADGNRVQGAGAGAIAGGLTGGALAGAARGIGSAMSGGGRPPGDAGTLSDNGVFMTPGSQRGGLAKSVEDLAQRAPIVGSAIRGARQRSVESVNRAVANRALANIGEGLPENIAPGGETVQYVARRLGREFDKAADMVPVVQVDEPFFQGVANIAQRVVDLPESKARQFQTTLTDRLSRLRSNEVSGKQIRGIESELTGLAATFESSGDASDRLLGSMLSDVAGEIQGLIARANPEAGDILNRARAGYRDYVVMRRASQAAGGNPFTPSQLLTAVRGEDSTVGNGATAQGSAQLQDLARAAKNVIPDNFGNPGTADALGWGALGTTAVTNPVAGAGAVGVLSAAATPYMIMGRKLVETLPARATAQQRNQLITRLKALAERDPRVAGLIEQVMQASQFAIPGAVGAMAAQ